MGLKKEKFLNYINSAGSSCINRHWTHLALHVRLLFSVLRVDGFRKQRVQADVHLFLSLFFILHLDLKKERGTRTDCWLIQRSVTAGSWQIEIQRVYIFVVPHWASPSAAYGTWCRWFLASGGTDWRRLSLDSAYTSAVKHIACGSQPLYFHSFYSRI